MLDGVLDNRRHWQELADTQKRKMQVIHGTIGIYIVDCPIVGICIVDNTIVGIYIVDIVHNMLPFNRE